jgi:hypothetical protein
LHADAYAARRGKMWVNRIEEIPADDPLAKAAELAQRTVRIGYVTRAALQVIRDSHPNARRNSPWRLAVDTRKEK